MTIILSVKLRDTTPYMLDIEPAFVCYADVGGSRASPCPGTSSGGAAVG
jgi:hypothetical protein